MDLHILSSVLIRHHLQILLRDPNWVRSYREECQTNDNEKSQLELMEELHKLRQENEELEKENKFLKKAAAFFAKEID